jgi:hypothetical protein
MVADMNPGLSTKSPARPRHYESFSVSMVSLSADLVDRFRDAVVGLEARFTEERLGDEDVEEQLRSWLDGADEPLPWTHRDRVTPDEWFFVTTLYGEMTMDSQRAHIRKYFPLLFVGGAGRDIRNFVPGMPEFAGLRSQWMWKRLCRMGEILRQRGLSMSEYTASLRALELAATPEDPMPALDAVIRDHRATGWKTLSVFVRDCVGGNCFPIDSRVEKALQRHALPVNERTLVGLSLAIGRNPRKLARLFYVAGGAAG